MNISVSRIARLTRCPRSYQLHYLEGVEPIEIPEPLSEGSAYHAGVEVIDSGGSMVDAITAATEHRPRNEMTWARARAEIVRYEAERALDITDVEIPFYLPVGGHTAAGRIDAIAIYEGRPVVVERKTRGREPNDDYWLSLARKLQTRVYAWAAREAGLTDGAAVLYEVCEKPRIKPRKGRKKDGSDADTPETYYERCLEKVVFHRRLIEPAGDDPVIELLQRAAEIEWRTEAGAWPCSERACEPVGGGRCEYADLCYSNYSPMVRDMYYRVNDFRRRG